MRKLKINSVRDAIQNEFWHSAGNDLLQYLLSRGVKITVFAGGVRDVVLAQECGLSHIKPRDWDVGISGISRKKFDGILRELGGSKNRYGGFKLFCDSSQSWEVWRQEDTVGLRMTGSSFGLKNLLRSFVLSCNAIAFDLDTGYICEYGALHSLFSGKITILQDAIMHDWGLFAAKALNLTFRRPLKLDAEVEKFVIKYLDRTSLVHEFQKVYSETNTLFSAPRIDEKHVRD